jgi:hypothetical protein
MEIVNTVLGTGYGWGCRYAWEAELSRVDGEINAICTRSYKSFRPGDHIHYMVHYPHQPLLCLTSFKGLVSHGHHINPETGIQYEYEWHKRKEDS